MRTIYLVFNEGYSPSSGGSVTRTELSQEAIRLARLVQQLLPEPEVTGLLALMLVHESRRAGRTSSEGELIALDEQDRAQWDSALIAEGSALVASALSSRRCGTYSLQAAISALHADAARSELTDWPEIVGQYDALMRLSPSPVVALNRAAALAFRDGPLVGLAQIDNIMAAGELDDYHLTRAPRADMYRRGSDVARMRARPTSGRWPSRSSFPSAAFWRVEWRHCPRQQHDENICQVLSKWR